MNNVRNILLIDAGLPDVETLAAARPEWEVRRVGRHEDGVGALGAALAAGARAIHVIAHDAPGRLFLGRRPLDSRAVAAMGAGRSGAELHVYGCLTGAGMAGRRLMRALATRIGGAVAAAAYARISARRLNGAVPRLCLAPGAWGLALPP